MAGRVLILTGLSGSGKTVALRALEDQGYQTVDNLPVPLLGQLARLQAAGLPDGAGLAVSIDGRAGKQLEHLPAALAELRAEGYDLRLIYLEAADDVLLARFRYTRRRHPFGYKTALGEAIRAERDLLRPLRQTADRIIDTTFLDPSALKSRVIALADGQNAKLSLLVTSFGFKYGNPTDADFTLDTRFLANPYYVDALRPLCGLDEPVRAYIYGQSQAEQFLSDCYSLFANLLPHYGAGGKNFAHLAVGCTGGRHRSVFVASWLAQRLEKLEGLTVTVRHRDLERGDK